jgi:hypothetical protein
MAFHKVVRESLDDFLCFTQDYCGKALARVPGARADTAWAGRTGRALSAPWARPGFAGPSCEFPRRNFGGNPCHGRDEALARCLQEPRGHRTATWAGLWIRGSTADEQVVASGAQ